MQQGMPTLKNAGADLEAALDQVATHASQVGERLVNRQQARVRGLGLPDQGKNCLMVLMTTPHTSIV